MDEKRMTLTIMADVQNFDDIGGLLPQIAALRKNYYVDLTISCPVPSKDQRKGELVDKFEIEKIKFEIETIKQLQDSLTYLITVFDRDLEKVERLLDQNPSQK